MPERRCQVYRQPVRHCTKCERLILKDDGVATICWICWVELREKQLKGRKQ